MNKPGTQTVKIGPEDYRIMRLIAEEKGWNHKTTVSRALRVIGKKFVQPAAK
jgi:hypothetical protein